MHRNRQLLVLWFFLWDLALTATAWVAAYAVRFWSGWIPLWKPIVAFDEYAQSIPLLLVLATSSYLFTGLYQVHRLRRFREELLSALKGVTLLVLLVLATLFYQQHHAESRLTMLLFHGLTLMAILTARRATWSSLRYLRRAGWNQAPALIVGTGRVARKMAHALQQASWTGMSVAGFVDEQPERCPIDLRILGSLSELPRLIHQHRIGHVFIALPLHRYHDARRVFDLVSQQMVDVRLVVDAPDIAGLTLATTVLEGLTVVGLRESPHVGINLVVKRVMDISLSLMALLVLSPLLGLLAVLVKWTSPGPVFYRQERCGFNGRQFNMLKFRTMRVHAEADTGPVWARKNDTRRTRFGAFLRRTSLDELPQLVNVLKGDMSLVGPRPERPVFIEKFKKTIPNYMARHAVKAGMTGWAQVNGWRGDTSLRRRVQHDLYYICHWNPWFDLRILGLTVVRAFTEKHAY
jgi:Undecaprenyl-phosphate glucose phosphotransferase